MAIESGYFDQILGVIIEVFYNATVMFLLSVSLINYMHRYSRKAMNMFLASICILFADIIQAASVYILKSDLLDSLCLSFAIVAYVLLYRYGTMIYKPMEFNALDEHVSALHQCDKNDVS
ncbi:MAG: hypothetical protein HRT67_00755 [Flavobacteriaceae bacterium]|nr:hypothetical protein [Flavobacteriaceae bacterium]